MTTSQTIGDILRDVREKMRDPSISEEDIAKMMTVALQGTVNDLNTPSRDLYQELEGLSAYIKTARHELAALQAAETVSAEHIPSAGGELDAIVAATEEATNTIMNCCDDIGAVAGRIGGADGDALNGCVTRIFEACNFQDITGQRIGKVVKTLKHIETHINQLVDMFGGPQGAPASREPSAAEQSLMNGPQLPGNGVSQEEIDKLLAGFDG